MPASLQVLGFRHMDLPHMTGHARLAMSRIHMLTAPTTHPCTTAYAAQTSSTGMGSQQASGHWQLAALPCCLGVHEMWAFPAVRCMQGFEFVLSQLPSPPSQAQHLLESVL